MISFYDPTTRTHYQFKDEQKRDAFLAKQKQQFDDKMKELKEVRSVLNLKLK